MDIQSSSTDLVRVDFSRVNQYVGPEPEHKSFWQKLKHGFSKFGSFLGNMASFVGPLFGPWGAIAGAAGYGVKTMANRSLQKDAARDQYDLATQSQPISVSLPGFMDEPSQANTVSSFVAPSHLEPEIQDVVLHSQDTQQTMMRSL